MPATQVLAPFAVEKIRTILSTCRSERTSDSYASRLVTMAAALLQSQHAVWLDWPVGAGCVVAETDGFNPLGRWLTRHGCVPMLTNEYCCDGIVSLVAAPIRFRDTVVGILAVANAERPYTHADLRVLEVVASAAVAEYESLRHAESLEMATRPQALAGFIHDLRQPMGVIEACAFLLEMKLPPEGSQREQVAEIFHQLDRASRILDTMTRPYTRPCDGETDDEPSDNRVFTNSAMSLVT